MTGPPDIRFYAGAPLVTASGLRLGSLCVIDREPRELDAEQLNVLCNFAEVVVREIEKDAARVRPAVRAACNSLARPHAPRAGVPERSGRRARNCPVPRAHCAGILPERGHCRARNCGGPHGGRPPRAGHGCLAPEGLGSRAARSKRIRSACRSRRAAC